MSKTTDKKPKFYLGQENLKAAGVQIAWSDEQVKEFKKCKFSPLYFIENYIKIISLDHGLIQFKPHEFQKEFIRNCVDNRFVIAKWPRQQGKTTTTAALLLWYVLFNKHFKIALLAHKDEQAREILGRVQLAFENLPDWLQQGVVSWNKGDIQFENGSLIKTYATSSGSIRGKTYNIIYLDEFAHVDGNVQEAFFTSTYPTISSGKKSKFIITSTPKGMEWFYKLWHDSEQGRNAYVRHEAHWSEMPGRDEAWKEETIRNTSEWQFNQEFNTEFLGSTNTLIDGQKLKVLTYDAPISEMGNIAFFKRAEKGHVYVLSVDCSEGLNQDYHAASVVDVTKTPYEVCAVYHDNKTHHLMLPNILYNLAMLYNEAMIMCETQSTGAQVATILMHDLEYEGVLSTTMKGKAGQRIGGGFGGEVRLGVMMNQQVKRIGCTNLKALIEQDKLVFHDERILKEFFTFTADKKSFRADEGKNDDLVMSLVIFAWMVAQNFFKDVTDTDVRRDMLQENIELIEQDLTPFGFISDGQDEDEPVHVGYF